MSLVQSRSRHDLRLLLTFDSSAWCYQYLKIYVGNLTQMSLQMSIFEILSCVLSCFLGFSTNSFPCFHFVFQKTVLFRTLRHSNIIFMNLSTCYVAFRWHYTVEISSKTKQNYHKCG
jgi:hypothetical protein